VSATQIESKIGEAAFEPILNKMAASLKERFGTPVLPEAGADIAVCIDFEKTAALFFDYVWWPPTDRDAPPKEIIAYGATDEEVFLQILFILGNNGIEVDKFDWDAIARELYQANPHGPFIRFAKHSRQGHWLHSISAALTSMHGLRAVALYGSRAAQEKEYSAGSHEVIVTAMENVSLVDEGALRWEQVLEVRADRKARANLRRMRHWLDAEMIGKPASYLGDAIAGKLEDYNWALRKHGIETVSGTVSSLFEPGFVTAASAALTGLSLAGGSAWATFGSLGLITGKIAVSVATRLVELEERKRGKDCEVAFVHEIQKKHGWIKRLIA